MPNKHAAGCLCCNVFECLDCEDVIESIVLTIGTDVVSWPLGKSIAELDGCTVLLRHCTDPVVWDLLDYSAVTAWDGRNGDCWKPFATVGAVEGDPDWIYNEACCDPSPTTGGGGGGGGVGPMFVPFNGPNPVTPGDCIACGSSYSQDDYTCQPTEYYISTFKIHDVTATVKLKTWYEYVAYLKFRLGAPEWRIFKTLFADVQHKVELSITGYYNDNCPRDELCVVSSEDCDEAVSGIAPDQVFGNFWCETATVGGGGLKDSRYFNCFLDTPNWVEATTSTYCFDSLMRPDGTWNDDCDQMVTPCTGTIRDIGGVLGVIVDSDEDWATARAGNATCWLINPTSRAWEVANSFGDWVAYALALREGSTTYGNPGLPFDFLMAEVGSENECNLRQPQVPSANDCVDGCREFILGRVCYEQILSDGAGQNEGQPPEDIGFYTCQELTLYDYYLVPGTVDEYSILGFGGNVPDIVFDFSECPVAMCSTGNPPDSEPSGCDFYHEDCCAGTTPATVTVPVGWTVPLVAKLSFIYA